MNRIRKVPGLTKENMEFQGYQSEHMEKDKVIELLKNQGFRITRQRKLLIDIILGEPCSCCKEVYVLASKKDPGIGAATVYRTVDALEKVGALNRRIPYQLCGKESKACSICLVEMEDNSTIELDCNAMEKIIESGMKQCGFTDGKRVKGITLMQEE